jgi:adenine-specific DNA-methyltransferase
MLADTGSIYVHLDWHVGHYVKLVMDEVLGRKNFQNEIIWHYSGWNKQLNSSFEKRHDTIFYYSKTPEPAFMESWRISMAAPAPPLPSPKNSAAAGSPPTSANPPA